MLRGLNRKLQFNAINCKHKCLTVGKHSFYHCKALTTVYKYEVSIIVDQQEALPPRISMKFLYRGSTRSFYYRGSTRSSPTMNKHEVSSPWINTKLYYHVQTRSFFTVDQHEVSLPWINTKLTVDNYRVSIADIRRN